MLDNNVNIDTKESSFKQQEGLSTWSYVVKYFNDYYIIVEYRQKDSVTEDNKIGEISTAVYKSVSSENLSELENIKNVGSHYYSYSTYPIAIASISTFGKIICAIFVALELFGVCKLISKHNHK